MKSSISIARSYQKLEFTDYAALFFFGLMILGGLAMIVSGAGDLRRAFASPAWPAVPGVILESEVSAKTSSGSRGSTMHNIKLTAGYQVNGRDYETGTIYYGFSGGSGDASVAQLEHLRYPAGAKVAVYHHPRESATAVLRPGFDLDVLGLPTGGLAVTLIGFTFVIFYLGGFKEYPVMALGFRTFGLVFLLAGAAMLTAGLLRFKHALDSRSWPVTAGVIVYAAEHSNTSEVRDSDGERHSATSYGAPLAYKFEVNGKTYFSNIRCFGALSGASKDWAQSILERYPTGARAPVSYDPADPNTAVLEPGVTSEAYWLPGAGAAFLLFGVAVLNINFRM
ncbi:MAG: DUF3592 domain-containing protein [Bryobacterales bacterium]|nr:DUF3592 domain-containing protein [Bryobacterales bacterium]